MVLASGDALVLHSTNSSAVILARPASILRSADRQPGFGLVRNAGTPLPEESGNHSPVHLMRIIESSDVVWKGPLPLTWPSSPARRRLILKGPSRRLKPVPMKKSEPWSVNIDLDMKDQCAPIIASLACEDVDAFAQAGKVHISVSGYSASDLRARFNSTMRSLKAASEALMSIDQQQNTEVAE
uniref:Uncharacterized protein n=1 Tax=uncultured marine group II/III euryarchaeote KM3_51_E06 TaxID=1456455 RepID=A0A075HA05_9EURY|nr:hypothetical protein [uncultured marine group II/III euryarchaeote KM3_51_E06]